MAKAKKGAVKAPKQKLVKSAKLSGNILTLVYEDGTEEIFTVTGSLVLNPNPGKSAKDEDDEDEDDEDEDDEDEDEDDEDEDDEEDEFEVEEVQVTENQEKNASTDNTV